jgi:signal transduction histidine kinase
MERLVKDLLRLARLDAGQETLDLVACDTRLLVQGVVDDLESAAEERRQRVDVTIAPEAAVVRADPAKTPRRASQPRGQRHHLLAGAEHDPRGSGGPVDGRMTMSVSDEGPGIPEEICRACSSAFYGVDKSRARDPAAPVSAWHRETPRRAARRRGPRRKP